MWICPKCKENLEEQFESCWNCGTGRDGSGPETSFIEAVSPVVIPTAGEAPDHRLKFTAIGGSGWPFISGHFYKVYINDIGLVISGVDCHEEIAYSELRKVEIFGPGRQTTSAEAIGGGFGIEGAAIGIGIAGLINAITTQTTTNTYLRIATNKAEVFLHNSVTDPLELRILMSRACVAAENSKAITGRSLVKDLDNLYSLFCNGALNEPEYATAKKILLAVQNEEA